MAKEEVGWGCWAWVGGEGPAERAVPGMAGDTQDLVGGVAVGGGGDGVGGGVCRTGRVRAWLKGGDARTGHFEEIIVNTNW